MATEIENGPDAENGPEEQPRRRKLLTVIIVGGVLIALIAGCSFLASALCGPSDEERAEERRKGFHCLSVMDGAHLDVKREVKNWLNDPDSFEHITTYITPVDADGYHSLQMEYRARNALGGMMRAAATAIVKNDGCDATILSYQ